MEKINFEDIRVGDVIEAHRTYSVGDDTTTFRGMVKKVDEPYVLTENFTLGNFSLIEYFLVERPKTTFKVGDTITGAQVADLPDGAVFDLNECGTDLRYKIDGEAYAARGSVISLDTYRERLTTVTSRLCSCPRLDTAVP